MTTFLRFLLLSLLILFQWDAFARDQRISKLQGKRKQGSVLLFLRPNEEKDIEKATKIWESRRKIAKYFLQSLKSLKDFRYRYFPPSETTNSSSTHDTASSEVDPFTWISILSIFLLPVLLRFGSRLTIAELVGLNLVDESFTTQLSSFLNFFQSLGPERFILIFIAWFIAKASCIDYLSLVLAIGSGILFENVWIATTTSVISASLASFLIFYITRYFAGERVQKDIVKRPLVRALDRSCKENGFKTVFSLRLSPVIPIPIAAYNYLYAVSSVSIRDFVLGITLGSIKPYLLDSYLGAFVGKSLLSSSEELTMTANEWITLGVILVIFLVGTFASQLVSSVWKEVQEEFKSMQQQQAGAGKREDSTGSLDLFTALGIDKQEVPLPLLRWNDRFGTAWKRLKLVIEDEGKSILPEAKMIKQSSDINLKDDRPSLSKGSSSPTKYDYEEEELSMANMLDYTIESSIFTIALWSIGNEIIANYLPDTPSATRRSE